ncbi:MAG: phosphate/phosphite/phosphonate ABC transporter substrate-binding protein [Candidatus Competibacteraceae bacterium]|nr:phosphate/phosphite/phosphonate ABC transporter substrate-binding protein [Candidatus Competibacteraceae bacterium]
MNVILRLGLALLLVGMCTGVSGAQTTDENQTRPEEPASRTVLTFGVVPQQAASKLARLWAPLLQRVSVLTGYQLEFRTAPDIPSFEQRLAAGEYDLAYMNPYHYTVFQQNPGYTAFGREKNKQIQGILVVRQDSSLQSIDDLAGTSVAFPAPAAFAASILPRAYLRQQGIAITPVYVSSHDSVYLNVARGFYPAGGGVLRTLAGIKPELRQQLRILWTTPAYTPHALAAHPRVPKSIRDVVAEAFVALQEDPQGQPLLQALGFKNGLMLARDADWDDIRALQLELLDASTGLPKAE